LLSLTKRLVELLGGEIRVKSTPGKGSVFSVILTLQYVGVSEGVYVAEERASVKALTFVPSEPAVERRPQILIIDDEKDLRYFLRSALVSKFNCDVLEASTGLAGLEMAKRYHPSMIFLDLNMDDLNRFVVFQELKSSKALREIPVIIHSGKNINQKDRELLQDAHGIFSKAYDSEEVLLERIAKIMAECNILPKRKDPQLAFKVRKPHPEY